MCNYENEVFVSYAWDGGESESTVKELERAFSERGICVKRDLKEIDYKGSISEFEERIGQGKCIVLVISDEYLRSEHCMNELVSADEKQNLRARIFPIVLASARIYEPVERAGYVKYWEMQIEELNQAITGIGRVTNTSTLIADLDKYAKIRASCDRVTDLLRDMNALKPKVHRSNNFSILIDAVEQAMGKKTVFRQIEFVNRENELGELNLERLHNLLSPFIHIGAPVGYGKSHLLHKLIRDAQENRKLKSKWNIRYVDFSESIHNQKQLMIKKIMGTNGGVSVEESELCQYVITNLTRPIRSGKENPAVLLAFDSIEKLNQESEFYLIQFLRELIRRTRELFIIKVILAGRDVDTFWEKYNDASDEFLAPKRVQLTPFKENAIEQLIGKQAAAAQIPLRDAMIKQIAWEVQYLSGGHPKIICDVVDFLAEELSFAIGIPSEYFLNNRRRLIESFVVPVADALLKSLDEEKRRIICLLSTFRCLTANTINTLVSKNLLAAGTQGLDLLEELSQAHLLDAPQWHDPFYRDHLMQRILALKIAHSPESRTDYLLSNRVAIAMYRELSIKLYTSVASDNIQPPYFLMEWLYHALQDIEMTNEELQGQFTELCAGLSLSPDQIGLCKNKIEEDFEIRYLIQSRFGASGIAAICHCVNHR